MTNPDFNEAVAQEVRRLQGEGPSGGYEPPPKVSGPTSFRDPIIQQTFREYKGRDGVLGPKAWYQEMFKKGEYPEKLQAVEEGRHRTLLTRLGIVEGLKEQFGTGMPETGAGWAGSKEQKQVYDYINDYKAILWSKGASPQSAHQIAIAAARRAFPHLSSDAIVASINALTTIPKMTSFGGKDIGDEIGPWRATKLSQGKLVEIMKDPYFQEIMKEMHKFRAAPGGITSRDQYLKTAYDDYYVQFSEGTSGRPAMTSTEASRAAMDQLRKDAQYHSVAMALLGAF